MLSIARRYTLVCQSLVKNPLFSRRTWILISILLWLCSSMIIRTSVAGKQSMPGNHNTNQPINTINEKDYEVPERLLPGILLENRSSTTSGTAWTMRRHRSNSMAEADAALNANSFDWHPTCRALPNGGPVSIVWAWDTPPTVNAMKWTLDGVLEELPGVKVAVWCSSDACIRAVHEASEHGHIHGHCVEVTRLFVPLLARGTPLEDWAGDHVMAKLMSAHNYESDLQVAMQLCSLWHDGGAVLLVGVRPSGALANIGKVITELVVEQPAGPVRAGLGGGLWAAAAPAADDGISTLMERMLVTYRWASTPDRMYDSSAWPVQVSWSAVCGELCSSSNARGLGAMRLSLHPEPAAVNHAERHFGTLSYQARRTYLRSINNPGMNIGDEMQGLAGIQFLPRIDAFVERDRLDVVDVISSSDYAGAAQSITLDTPPRPATVRTTVFFNAWWGTKSWVWPPPGELDPVMVSMHLEPNSVRTDVAKSKYFLDAHWPIGARDTNTHSFFVHNGIHSLFSGCMTMTLLPSVSAERAAKERTDEILIVDASEEALAVIPESVLARATRVSHKLLDPELVGDNVERYASALAMLRRYQRAKLVITQRLHVALPSASVGTPCILILTQNLPGGGGKGGLARFSGLQLAVHTVDAAKGLEALSGFDFDHPPPNPNREVIETRRDILRVLSMCHDGLRDSARKFGAVPPHWKHPYESDPCSDLENDGGDEETIHIVTALTPDWFDGGVDVFASWLNALSVSNPSNQIVLHLLTDKLNSKQRCLARWMVQRAFPNGRVKTNTLPVGKMLAGRPYHGLRHIPAVTQARLSLGSLLPCVRRVIYIDLDAFVIRDLKPLWELETPSCGIVARTSVQSNVIEGMLQNLIKRNEELHRSVFFTPNTWTEASHSSRGFNAGVMVIDLDKLRHSRFEETTAKYWAFHLGANDQVTFNLHCNGTHNELDPIWNVFNNYRDRDSLTYRRSREWGIVHFQSSEKPWTVERSNSQLGDEASRKKKSSPVHQLVWERFSTDFVSAMHA